MLSLLNSYTFFVFLNIIYLFVYLFIIFIFVCTWCLVPHADFLQLGCTGLSLLWLLLWSIGSRSRLQCGTTSAWVQLLLGMWNLPRPGIKLLSPSLVGGVLTTGTLGNLFHFLFKYRIFFKFYFIFKLYIIVLVLPNIKMNPPQVYMCSPS